MRIALTLGLTLALVQAVPAMAAGNMGETLPVPSAADASPSADSLDSTGAEASSAVAPRVLSPADVALYRQIIVRRA